MTKTVLVYQPRPQWRVGVAFAAALLIHFAAIAIASVHRVEKPASVTFTENIPELIFEQPPSETVDPKPDDPEPMPTPAQTDVSFPEDKPTPPPIRRHESRPITPLVKPRNNGQAGARTWSSAKVLALSAPRPEYPYEARRQCITGEGIVAMTVDPGSGQVTGVSMAKSTGSPFLDNAAVAGFRKWRFKPGTVSSVQCPITFTLAGASY